MPKADAELTSNRSDELLTLAAQLFRAQGYAAVSTRELAAALGVQNASLYYYIKSKEDLLYQICIDAVTDLTDQVRAAIAAQPDPLSKFRTFITCHIRTALGDRDKHATMLLEMRSLPEQKRDEVLQLRKVYVQLVRGLLKDLQKAQLIRTDLGVRKLSLAIFNTLNWTLLWYQPQGSDTVDEVSEFLYAFILSGVEDATVVQRRRPTGRPRSGNGRAAGRKS